MKNNDNEKCIWLDKIGYKLVEMPLYNAESNGVVEERLQGLKIGLDADLSFMLSINVCLN